MRREATPSEEVLSIEEATERLAEATDSPVEEIANGVEAPGIRPPHEATVVED